MPELRRLIALIEVRNWQCWRMDESTFILMVGAFTAVYIAGWLLIGRLY